jgi:hypothetical protein
VPFRLTCCFPQQAQGAVISKYIRRHCDFKPCAFSIGFANPRAPGVKYCLAMSDRRNICIPDDNTYKGLDPDVQPPAPLAIKPTRQPPATVTAKRTQGPGVQPFATAIAKRGQDPKPRGGLYKTERGMEVSFSEDLEPGTPIKHARARRAASLKKRAVDYTGIDDTGDGDDLNNEDDGALLVRSDDAGPFGMPDFEIVDDVIAYKME